MRTTTARAATGLLLSLLAAPVPAALQAQRRLETARPMTRPPIPHAPMARAPGRTAPLFEPGRPHDAVPYVRDDHWYGQAAPNGPRFHLARPFQFGHFALTGPAHVFRVARVDLGARRVWLPGGGFEIAQWDRAVTAPWCWACDEFVVYPDPDHAGWYLLYDARLGKYAHATFLGP